MGWLAAQQTSVFANCPNLVSSKSENVQKHDVVPKRISLGELWNKYESRSDASELEVMAAV